MTREDRLRVVAGFRPLLVGLVLLGPMLFALGADLWRRAPRLLELNGLQLLGYLAALLESGLVWSLLLYVAARRRGSLRHVAAGVFVLLATLVHAGQSYFFEQYNVYLNVDVSRFATDFTGSVVNQFLADLTNYLRVLVPAAILSIAWVMLARRWVRPVASKVRVAAILAPCALLLSFLIPTQHRQAQASTPDVLYLNALGGLLSRELGFSEEPASARPRLRQSLPVPKLTPRSAQERNIVLFILESVRADSVCLEYSAHCRKTPFSNALVSRRTPLLQMRSLASSTAISLAVLWTGVGPEQSREVLHTWPLIFDYARSAGFATAFWTSQNMLFGSARLWVEKLGVDKFCSATDLDPASDLDMGADEALLSARIEAELGQLKQPFLAVIQLSNVHYPYRVEEAAPQPFQPARMSKAPEHTREFFNHYQNAVHQQDRHVARMIESIRQAPGGNRTVILYTSDHGEAFREHHQMGHTFSIFDEEIKVPGWVDAPEGTLSPNEAVHLSAKSEEFVFHVDVAPTILDLMGVWESPAIARFRALLPGTSLLRKERTEAPLPMTNCAGVWGCAFENWGVMRRNLKLQARAWDRAYRCYDVALDPSEQQDLGEGACSELKLVADRTFGRLPGRSDKKLLR